MPGKAGTFELDAMCVRQCQLCLSLMGVARVKEFVVSFSVVIIVFSSSWSRGGGRQIQKIKIMCLLMSLPVDVWSTRVYTWYKVVCATAPAPAPAPAPATVTCFVVLEGTTEALHRSALEYSLQA